MKRVALLACALASVLVSVPLPAQRSAQPTRTLIQISGQVRLPGGAPAPQGVQVILESEALGLIAQINTDSSGKFVFNQIGQGMYLLRARQPGFKETVQRVDIRTASTGYAMLELQPLDSRTPLPPEGPSAAISAVPEDARKDFERGNSLLMDKKDAKGSIPFFQKAIKAYPSYADAYFLMGTAYLDQEKWKEAQEFLRKALTINDKIPGAYLGIGSCLAAQQKFAEAEKPLLQGLELDDRSSQGHYELGRVYWALSRPADALPHARRAVELDPKFAPGHVLLGNVLLRNRDALGALREFQDYLRLEPKGPLVPQVQDMVKKIENALQAK